MKKHDISLGLLQFVPLCDCCVSKVTLDEYEAPTVLQNTQTVIDDKASLETTQASLLYSGAMCGQTFS